MQWVFLSFFFALAISATSAGVVEGALQCPEGGTGKFVQMELTSHNIGQDDCTVAPCLLRTVTQNASYELSLTFIAGEAASELFFEIWFIRADGGVNPFVRENIDSVLAEGSEYVFPRDFTVPARFGIGGPHYGDLSIMIYNRATNSRMTCGSFPIEVITDE